MISSSIINSCIRNERRAQEQCYKTCAPYVYTIVKNYIADHNKRKDAMQEIFASIFLSLTSFDENKGSFKSWISQISINQCISILRKDNKLKLFVPLELTHENIESRNHLLNSISKEEIETLLVKMPVGYRTVFLLSVIDGYNHKEISHILKITKETSRSQLSRSINWIKKNIKAETKKLIYG